MKILDLQKNPTMMFVGFFLFKLIRKDVFARS